MGGQQQEAGMIPAAKGEAMSHEPYPLGAVVLAAFNRERPAHDATSIAMYLAGGLVLQPGSKITSGAVHRAAMKAYRLVAKDVLGCLESDGFLYRDSLGWYRRKKTTGYHAPESRTDREKPTRNAGRE
jgi:hypothetical protein